MIWAVARSIWFRYGTRVSATSASGGGGVLGVGVRLNRSVRAVSSDLRESLMSGVTTWFASCMGTGDVIVE